MKLLYLRGEWTRVKGGPVADNDLAAKLEPKPPPQGEEQDPLAITGPYPTITDWILDQVQARKDPDEN